MDPLTDLRALFDSIDVYLFDQLLKGRIPPGSRILDAGCGRGRNLRYFLLRGDPVHGIDRSATAIDQLKEQLPDLGREEAAPQFHVGELSALPFDDASFDLVVSNAVLHFARSEAEFRTQLDELWRVLAPGGFLFCRLASSIGIESRIRPVEGRIHDLPDGSRRFLVDEEFLLKLGEELQGRLLDPIKTTNVQGLRCMTTWVLARGE